MTESEFVVAPQQSSTGATMNMVLDWPMRHSKSGKPVTTPTNQAILTACVEAALEDLPDHVQLFRTQLQLCQNNWRQEYGGIFQTVTEIMAEASQATVLRMCQAGLDKAVSSFVMRQNDTTTLSLHEYMNASSSDPPLKTLTFQGKNQSLSSPGGCLFHLASPHGTDENPLWITGSDAIAQLNAWKDYGCMEPSAAMHAQAVCEASDVSVYVQNKTFCLLGVTSELGPAHHLLKIPGARVLGIARGGHKLDQLTQQWVPEHAASSATLQVPAGGANLLEQPLRIAEWILETAPANEPLVLYPLVYMDGEANVRVTVAMDLVVTHVLSHRSNVSLAYLTSPTTVYTIPREAAIDAQARYERDQNEWFSVTQWVRMASLGYWLAPVNTWKQLEDNADEDDNTNVTQQPAVVFNGTFQLQGPNYCLAKTMQMWRGMVAHYHQGIRVAAPHAPGTRTWSVMHSAEAAAAVEGIQYIPPLLTFDVQPSSSLMTAIVLHQLHENDVNNESYRQEQHPLELFWDGAVHGGGWRCPYSYDSILVWTYMLGKMVASRGWCPEGALAPRPTVRSDDNV